MGTKRALAVVLLTGLFALFACTVAFGQASPSPPASSAPVQDPAAVSLVNQAVASTAGALPVHDVTLEGTATYTEGSDAESGTATLEATARDESLVSLNLSDGAHQRGSAEFEHRKLCGLYWRTGKTRRVSVTRNSALLGYVYGPRIVGWTMACIASGVCSARFIKGAAHAASGALNDAFGCADAACIQQALQNIQQQQTNGTWQNGMSEPATGPPTTVVVTTQATVITVTAQPESIVPAAPR